MSPSLTYLKLKVQFSKDELDRNPAENDAILVDIIPSCGFVFCFYGDVTATMDDGVHCEYNRHLD